MLALLLTLATARADSSDVFILQRLALLQISHRLGHHRPITTKDPDRGVVYNTLFATDYRGQVFRVIECLGDIAPGFGDRGGPLLEAFARDGYGRHPTEIRTKLMDEVLARTALYDRDPDALAMTLSKYLVKPSPAAKILFTPAFTRTQENVVEMLGLTRNRSATRALGTYLRGLRETFGPDAARAPGFDAAVRALRRVNPEGAVAIVASQTGVLIDDVLHAAEPPRPCATRLSAPPPSRSWWRRIFRLRGPT